MPYQVLLERSAEKELDALPASFRERIVARLLYLEENPRPVGVRCTAEPTGRLILRRNA